MTERELGCMRSARDLRAMRDTDIADELVERGLLRRTDGLRYTTYRLTTQGANALRDLGTSTPGPSGLAGQLSTHRKG